MSIPTIGKINIASFSPSGSSVTLDTDPATYKRPWPRRQTILEGIPDATHPVGSVTKQDSGRTAKDMSILLDSGPNQWLNLSTVKTLIQFSGRKGATFTFTDAENNEFIVTFESFDPYQAPGMFGLYSYTAEFRVWQITKLLGDVYTGN